MVSTVLTTLECSRAVEGWHLNLLHVIYKFASICAPSRFGDLPVTVFQSPSEIRS